MLTKYQGLSQILCKAVEKIFSYLRGRKMAERKKEVVRRWIVGYVSTSQQSNRCIKEYISALSQRKLADKTENGTKIVFNSMQDCGIITIIYCWDRVYITKIHSHDRVSLKRRYTCDTYIAISFKQNRKYRRVPHTSSSLSVANPMCFLSFGGYATLSEAGQSTGNSFQFVIRKYAFACVYLFYSSENRSSQQLMGLHLGL